MSKKTEKEQKSVAKSSRERLFRIIREHDCPTLKQELGRIRNLERIDKHLAEREKGWLERARVALGGKPKFRSRYPTRFADVLANHGCPALIRELKEFHAIEWHERKERLREQGEDEERRKVYGVREVREALRGKPSVVALLTLDNGTKKVHGHLQACDECQPDYRHVVKVTRLDEAIGHVLRLTRGESRTLLERLALIEANPFSLKQPSGYISIAIGGPQARAKRRPTR